MFEVFQANSASFSCVSVRATCFSMFPCLTRDEFVFSRLFQKVISFVSEFDVELIEIEWDELFV